jgi:NAD(P)H-hydrate epimerase
VLSLDLPSGVDATSGETFGIFVQAERVLTLALPKTGLHNFEGDLFVADLGIPSEVFLRLGLQVEPFFGEGSWVRLEKMKSN